MRQTNAMRPTQALLIALVALVASLAAPATAQDPCLEPPKDDVKFVVRWEHWQNSALGPTRLLGNDTISEQSWSVSDPHADTSGWPKRTSNFNTSGSAADGTLSGTISGSFRVEAPDTYTVSDGAEYVVTVDAYILGPQGTPYFLYGGADGTLEMDRNAGGTFFASYSMPGGSGNGAIGSTVPFNVSQSVSTGMTSSQQHPSDPDYTFAGSRTFNFDGEADRFGCIIFCSGTRFWEVEGAANITVSAGRARCSGVLAEPVVDLPDASTFAVDRKLKARFDMLAVFLDDPPLYECSSCRYRQFVISQNTWEYLVIPGRGERAVNVANYGGSDPCNAPELALDCPVEDTVCAPACRTNGRLAYGDRVEYLPNPECTFAPNNRYLDSPSGPVNQASGCLYHGKDRPGFETVPISGRERRLRYDHRFVGVVLDVHTERVVARQDWEVCFEATEPPGDNGAIVTPCSKKISLPRAGSAFRIGDRGGAVVIQRDGDLLYGSVSLDAEGGEFLRTSDVPVDLMGMTTIPLPDEEPLQVGSNLGSSWVIPFASTFSGALPPAVDVTVEFDGQQQAVTVDLSVLAGDCPADIAPAPDGDGQVNTNDFFQFLTYYQSMDPAADFTGEGDVNTNDFFAFLAAYQAGCP